MLLPLLPLPSLAASFDCQDAERELDETICADEELGALDERMADYYFKLNETLARKEADALLRAQRDWLKRRPRWCDASDSSCLVELYRARILALRKDYENLVPYTAIDPTSLQGVRSRCGFDEKLPKDLLIYAGGAYAGRKIDHQIDQSGHQATQFEVIVNAPDRPVALLLGAYEPSIWNIAWTPDTQISAVVATGYHRQAVAGLPDDTPVLISSIDNRGPCGWLYIAQKNLERVNPLSIKAFGRKVDMVHYASGGNLVLGQPISADDELFTSQDNPPESFIGSSVPLAGNAGLEQLVAQGALRRASFSDVDRWESTKAQRNQRELPPVANPDAAPSRPSREVHNGYVILKKITIPAGLYGANSATFFLTEGVPYPDGSLGHSTLYDFGNVTCRGTRCGL